MPDSSNPSNNSSARRRSESVQATICLHGSTPRPVDLDPVTQPDVIELSDAEPIPAVDGRYRILREIGRGGMGVVFRGFDRELERELAVKVLREQHSADSWQVERFRREAWVVGQLQHPGIIPLYDLGESVDNRPYLVMKLIEGQTLANLLRRRVASNADRAGLLKIYDQVCQTIAYAHSRGVVHRDLKPSNIMVGEFGEVQVMDWGLARILPSSKIAKSRDESLEGTWTAGSSPDNSAASATIAGEVIGTPAYMPPEQANGLTDVDERSDVFGLGAILCEILIGRPPYLASKATEALIQARAADQTELRKRLQECGADKDLIALACDCLESEPLRRPANASEVVQRLHEQLDGAERRQRNAEVERAAAVARLNGERKRRRLAISLGAALLALIVIAAGGAVTIGHQRARRAEERAQVEKEKTERHAEASRRILKALEEADELQTSARAAGGALPLWSKALAAARRAEAVPIDEINQPELSHRIQRTIADIAAEEKKARSVAADRRMIAQIEEARLAKSALKNGQFDMGRADPVYAAAFRDYGIDIEHISDDEAVRRIGDRKIKFPLSIALVDWAMARRVNKSDPKEPLVLRLIGIALRVDTDSWRQKFYKALLKHEAESILKLSQSPQAEEQDPATIFLLTSELGDDGNSKVAIDLLQRTVPRYPSDFWLNFRLAFFLLDSTPPQTEEAVRYLTAAVAIRPQSPGARVNLSYALMRLGRYREALPHELEAIRLEPTYSDAYNNLGASQIKLNQLDEAVKNLRLAIKYKPNNAIAYQNLAQACNEKGDCGAALDAATNAIRLDGKNPIPLIDQSIAYLRLNRPKEAEASARKAIELSPTLQYARFTLANVLGAQGRNADAAAELKESIRLNPDHAESYCNLGHALEQLGKFSEALDALKRGDELGRRQPGWRYPSEQWVKECSELSKLNRKFALVCTGFASPVNAEEGLALSQFALEWKHQPTLALTMFQSATDFNPELAKGAPNIHRGRAIQAAAIVQREGSDEMRDHWRQSALNWLRADLSFWEKADAAKEREAIRMEVERRLDDPGLQLFRDTAELAKLPQAEREQWKQFWGEMKSLQSRLAKP
jgi:serine/threonine-protein kinase